MGRARQSRLWRAVLLAGCAGLLPANCAWDAGEPFATVDAHLEAHVDVPAGRALEGDWQRLASSYELTIERLEVDTGALALIDSGGGALGFDPANPPPGYSLCHNGHCHADDGSLVSYEDIAASLGQGTGATTVVLLPVGDLDLIDGVSRALACVPDCDLPLADIGLATLPARRVHAEGLVRDGRAPARIDGEVPWQMDLILAADEPLTWSSPIALPADRVHAPEIALKVEIALGSPLFDDIAWAALDAGAGAIDVAADPDARAAVLEALGEARLAIDVDR